MLPSGRRVLSRFRLTFLFQKPVAKIIKVLAATGDAVGLVNGVTSIGDDDVDSVLADEFLHQHLARSEGIFPVFLHAQFDAMGGDGHVITKVHLL